MLISRRAWFTTAVAGAASSLLARVPFAAAQEARPISWPSRVVQLPPDDDSHRPPVVTAVRLHRDGQQLATAGDDHRVRVWNLADGALLHKLDAHTDWVRSIDYSPDGRYLASTGNDRQIIFWDAATGTQIEVFSVHDAAIAAIRFSHDGRFLAAVGFEGVARLYDVATRQVVAQPLAPCQDVRAVTFSPDDQLLAVGGRCGSIRLLSVPRGDPLRDIAAHRQRIRAIAFSSDGSYLASAGEDRLIHVAPVAGGEGYSLPARPAKVLALAFYGPHHLATAGSDNQEETGCLRGHTGSVAALECQGKVLVSAGYDTTIRIWEVGDRVARQPAEIGPRQR
jgi:WD40 repeat protein